MGCEGWQPWTEQNEWELRLMRRVAMILFCFYGLPAIPDAVVGIRVLLGIALDAAGLR